MSARAERRSTLTRAILGTALACVLACAGTSARAQAPSCAWGDGVAFPGGDNRPVLIADDGGAGVIAITWPLIPSFPVYKSSLRFFHVLEQGRLDPSLPADGVPLISDTDLPAKPEMHGLRVLADGAGGAYVLFRNCSSTMPHLRCWETSEYRLLHATAQGTIAPGWPALGIVIGAIQSSSGMDNIGIVLDGPLTGGASGVIAGWIAVTPDSVFPYSIRAQRFAPDGTPQWPGGVGGLTVLAPHTQVDEMALGGDHAGGCSVIASQWASSTNNRYELFAGRADAAGGLPWTVSGKLVMQQPTYSVHAQSVSVDDLGRSFVTAVLRPVSSGTWLACTQLLSPLGVRLWGQFGMGLGSSDGSGASGFVTMSGFESVHGDAAGMGRFQLQDESGTPQWDPESGGIAADWTTPPSPQLALPAPDGHTLSVWMSREAAPNDGVRAMELDESGAVVPGWPGSGVAVCGVQAGHYLGDAIVSGSQLFVALASDEFTGLTPKVQRMSRAVLAVEADLPARPLELSPPAPNPARGDWTMRLGLRTEAEVTLEAFDIAGRRVLSAGMGRLPAGRHVLAVPGGASLAPGVYRIRARTGPHAAERVLVKVR